MFCTKNWKYETVLQDEYKLVTVQPYLTVDQLDAAVKPIIEEYLEHGNTAEVEVSSQKSFWFCLYYLKFFAVLLQISLVYL